MDLLEFVKKFTVFKPSPYHEALFEAIENIAEHDKSTLSITARNYGRRWYKKFQFNEFQYSQLIKMAEGQTFALATPKGIHIFKKTEFKSIQDNE